MRLPPNLCIKIRKVFGAIVRSHRLAAGPSNDAVADRMGVDQAYLGAIERALENVTLL